MKTYRHIFTVKGRGQFPFDMLRYDACIPESSKDADRLAGDATAERRSVTLYRDANRHWRPTDGRWGSFSWIVTDHMTKV